MCFEIDIWRSNTFSTLRSPSEWLYLFILKIPFRPTLYIFERPNLLKIRRAEN